MLADGDLVISTSGSFAVAGASGADEDLIRFTPSALGATASGTWSMCFDGSDVGLNSSSDEDVWGTWVDEATGDVYLTTCGVFSVDGASGDGADIFAYQQPTLGTDTSCTFSGLYWDDSVHGFGSERVDSITIQ